MNIFNISRKHDELRREFEAFKASVATLHEADSKRIAELEQAHVEECAALHAEIAELQQRLNTRAARQPHRSFAMLRNIAEMGAQRQ